MIRNAKDYMNRYDAGQRAVDRADWPMARECFKDCLEYLKYYEPWRDDDIEDLERLIENCRAMYL